MMKVKERGREKEGEQSINEWMIMERRKNRENVEFN